MSMAMNYGDLDNDGMLDLYFGTGQPDIRALQPNRMYKNVDGKKFLDVTSSGNFGHLQKGHGISFADLDNDGDMDVYGQMGGAYFGDFFRDAIYLNPGHGNHYLKIELQGVQTNRKALGSRIFIEAVDEEGNVVKRHHFMSTGGSYGSNALEVHVGLGKSVKVTKVTVWWQKTGEKQVFTDLDVDQKVLIVEGKNEYQVVKEPSFVIDTSKLGKRTKDVHHATCHHH